MRCLSYHRVSVIYKDAIYSSFVFFIKEASPLLGANANYYVETFMG